MVGSKTWRHHADPACLSIPRKASVDDDFEYTPAD